MPALHTAIAEILGEGTWALTPTEPGTLEFAYPVSLGSALTYIRPVVKVEMGARNDTWPAEERPIVPYIAEVRVLAAARIGGGSFIRRAQTWASSRQWGKSSASATRGRIARSLPMR